MYDVQLEKYRSDKKTVYDCPVCGIKKFTRYIVVADGRYIDDNVGKCSRINKCGFHFPPKDFYQKNPNVKFTLNPKNHINEPSKPISYIDKFELDKSLETENNDFIEFLNSKFSSKEVSGAINNYRLGTSQNIRRGVVFWQIDVKGNIRSGKVMAYDPSMGKRKKNGYNFNWMHKILKLKDFNLKQCFYGEHLIKDFKDSPIAIVESEKTAIVASILAPRLIWLAAGSATGINHDKMEALRGRKVILYPDLGQEEYWDKKAKELSMICDISLSSLLYRFCSEKDREEGLDIADFLLRE